MNNATTPRISKAVRKASEEAPKSAPSNSPEVVRLPIAQILFDHAWNARSQADTERVVSSELAGFDAESESTGLGGGGEKTEPGLIELIELQGQLDPIDVRPNPDPMTSKEFPFKAVDGFRRKTALLKIAEWGVKMGNPHPIKADPEWSAEAPEIWAIVRPMTETEARTRNLTENTGQKLSTPDLAFGVEALRRASKEEGKEMTGKDIATHINKSKTLVSQMLSVMRLPKNITEHWRTGGVGVFDGKTVVTTSPLSLDAMYGLRDVEPADIEKEYSKLLMVTEGGKSRPGKSPEMKSFDSAVKKANRVGAMMGWLAYSLHNLEKPTPGDWQRVCEELVAYVRPNGKEATESQTKQIVAALKESFKLEQDRLANPEGDAEEEESEERIQKKRDKRDGGR